MKPLPSSKSPRKRGAPKKPASARTTEHRLKIPLTQTQLKRLRHHHTNPGSFSGFVASLALAALDAGIDPLNPAK